MLILYNSLILPYLQYCILSWGFNSDKLFKLRKRAARIITYSKYNAHTEPLLEALNLLKIDDIMKIKALKLYYRYKQNELPKYFDSKFAESNNNHSHHTRHKSIRYQLPTKTGTGRLSVRHCIPKILTITPECKTEKLNTHSLNPIQATFSTIIHGKIHGGIITVIHCSSPQKSQQCDVGAPLSTWIKFNYHCSACELLCTVLPPVVCTMGHWCNQCSATPLNLTSIFESSESSVENTQWLQTRVHET